MKMKMSFSGAQRINKRINIGGFPPFPYESDEEN